jgi:hypothetical protein
LGCWVLAQFMADNLVDAHLSTAEVRPRSVLL